MQVLPPILIKIPLLAGILSIFRIFLLFGFASTVSLFGNVAQHSLIIKLDGSLHTFGWNSHGQLGDGTTTDRNTPTQILASGVSQIAAGYYHSLFSNRMVLCILLVRMNTDNWGMVQIPTETHPHKSLLPGSLKLPLDFTTLLFSNQMVPSILLVTITTDNWGMVLYQQKYTHTNSCLRGFTNCRRLSPTHLF